jgi:protein SCO1/2
VTNAGAPHLLRIASRGLVACIAAMGLACIASAATSGTDAGLPRIGPAPAFTLVDQDGRRFSLSDVRGRVAVVTFIFTTCSSTCPLLTAKLVGIQRKLGAQVAQVYFTAITVDPLNDTPAALKKYARAHSADLASFAFLTGSFEQIEDVARRYAVFRKDQPAGEVDHTFLTSLIDRNGILRVQYLGTRFDPEEFTRDLRSLMREQAGDH